MKKLLNDSMKIIETLLERIEVINSELMLIYEEILERFLEKISARLVKNYFEISEKLWKNRKHFAQTWKKRYDGNLVKVSMQFLEELMKNCTETSDNFRKKLQKSPKFWKYLGRSWKSGKGRIKIQIFNKLLIHRVNHKNTRE